MSAVYDRPELEHVRRLLMESGWKVGASSSSIPGVLDSYCEVCLGVLERYDVYVGNPKHMVWCANMGTHAGFVPAPEEARAAYQLGGMTAAIDYLHAWLGRKPR